MTLDGKFWEQQAHSLAKWWLDNAIDELHGGFYGEIAFDNRSIPEADKCIILNARILWFFSNVAARYRHPAYAQAATRAYDYLRAHFYDKKNGGFYWSVDAAGEPVDTRKHIYAEAFCIYAVAAYFEFSLDPTALDLALETYGLIQMHACDSVHGGYFESFDHQWRMSEDARLSEKEDNFPKTMNTHLHMLEALSGLLAGLSNSDKDSSMVKASLVEAIKLFCDKIVDRDRGCVKMFFDDQWRDKSESFSFGHDVESAWLLEKAVAHIGEPEIDDLVQPVVKGLMRRSLSSGLYPSGRMRDEVDRATARESPTAWWVQFEAMVGFAYAFRATGDPIFARAVDNVWHYTASEYHDAQFGEWHWFANSDVPFAHSAFKVGAWKAPYHTGRAFLELSAMNLKLDQLD